MPYIINICPFTTERTIETGGMDIQQRSTWYFFGMVFEASALPSGQMFEPSAIRSAETHSRKLEGCNFTPEGCVDLDSQVEQNESTRKFWERKGMAHAKCLKLIGNAWPAQSIGQFAKCSPECLGPCLSV